MKIPEQFGTEANIQAELYSQCKTAGINCALEVSTPVGRLDVAVFSSDWSALLAVVECKRRLPGHKTGQIRRYESIGVPVFLVASMDVKVTVQHLKTIVSGVPWEKVTGMEKKQKRRRNAEGLLVRGFNRIELDPDINLKD